MRRRGGWSKISRHRFPAEWIRTGEGGREGAESFALHSVGETGAQMACVCLMVAAPASRRLLFVSGFGKKRNLGYHKFVLSSFIRDKAKNLPSVPCNYSDKIINTE